MSESSQLLQFHFPKYSISTKRKQLEWDTSKSIYIFLRPEEFTDENFQLCDKIFQALDKDQETQYLQFTQYSQLPIVSVPSTKYFIFLGLTPKDVNFQINYVLNQWVKFPPKYMLFSNTLDYIQKHPQAKRSFWESIKKLAI